MAAGCGVWAVPCVHDRRLGSGCAATGAGLLGWEAGAGADGVATGAQDLCVGRGNGGDGRGGQRGAATGARPGDRRSGRTDGAALCGDRPRPDRPRADRPLGGRGPGHGGAGLPGAPRVPGASAHQGLPAAGRDPRPHLGSAGAGVAAKRGVGGADGARPAGAVGLLAPEGPSRAAAAARAGAATHTTGGRGQRVRELARVRSGRRPQGDRLEGDGPSEPPRGAELAGGAEPERGAGDRCWASHAGADAGPGARRLRPCGRHACGGPSPSVRRPGGHARLRRPGPAPLAAPTGGHGRDGGDAGRRGDQAGGAQLPPGRGVPRPNNPQALAGGPLLRRDRRRRVASAGGVADPDHAHAPADGRGDPQPGAGAGRRSDPFPRGRRLRASRGGGAGAGTGRRPSDDAPVGHLGRGRGPGRRHGRND